MVSLDAISEVIYDRCFDLKEGESVLIIEDEDSPKNIGMSLFRTAKDITKDVELVRIPTAKINGQEPDDKTAELMKGYDVIAIITTMSMTHTKARIDACKAGARIASMPGITEDIYLRAIETDYDRMEYLTRKLKGIMDPASDVHITSELGTDMVLSIKGRESKMDYCNIRDKGTYDNIPSGECFIAPLEASANGVYIVDACMGTGLLADPVKITFKDGKAVGFEGKEAQKIKDLFVGMPDKAFTVAELGIGTNEDAEIRGKVLEDEKVLGTCHIALGNNIGFGGKTDVGIHIDGVIRKPTIHIDGRKVMESGKLLI